MADQTIALQARAPQGNSLAAAIRQNSQLMNMMTQQAAAQRQAEVAQQQMQLAQAEEGRKAELHRPAMDKAGFESTSAKIKMVDEFLDLSIEGMKAARNPEDALKIGGWLKTQFSDPQLQEAVDQTLSSLPQDPSQFDAWRQQTLYQSMDAKDQLAQEVTNQNTGRETFQTVAPKYAGAPGGGAALEVPGTRVQAAEGITYVRGPNGEAIPVPKTMPGTGGLVGGEGMPGAGGDTFSRMINRESRGQQFDRSGKPLTSRAGAIGIAQVMPGTAPEAARLAGLPFDENRYRNDPEYNLALGKAYYEKQLADFGDERLAAAAYNAGPGAVRRALQKGGPNGWINHVPRETQDYVRDVFGAAPAGRGSAGGPDIRFGEAIPGTGKGEKVAAEAYTAMDSAMARYDNTIKLAEDLLNNPALDSIIGNIQGNIPETLLSLSSQDAANALADYNTLIAVAGFSELQTLKAESKTGAALGPVSDRENTFLQQSAFKTSRAQDETKFRQSLRDFIKRVQGSKERVETGYERTYGGRFTPAAAPAGAGDKPKPEQTRTASGATVTDW
jgi:hypothetical protein